MTKNQSSRAAEKEALRDRKQHLMNLIELVRNKRTKLNNIETLSVKAMYAEAQRVEGRLSRLA